MANAMVGGRLAQRVEFVDPVRLPNFRTLVLLLMTNTLCCRHTIVLQATSARAETREAIV